MGIWQANCLYQIENNHSISSTEGIVISKVKVP
jgi:hypothetical protein